MKSLSEQENFWHGRFGDDYIERNKSMQIIASNTALFGKIISRTLNIQSILELGANIGMNLHAMRALLPQATMSAVEINEKAATMLKGSLPDTTVYRDSILTFVPTKSYDLVFAKGVLIHLPPESLPEVYGLMYRASNKYILMVEYYNPTPVSIPYRGHANKLFKRDFAGEFLNNFPNVRLVDYGFVYHRDSNFPADDSTWFLMEKQPA